MGAWHLRSLACPLRDRVGPFPVDHGVRRLDMVEGLAQQWGNDSDINEGTAEEMLWVLDRIWFPEIILAVAIPKWKP